MRKICILTDITAQYSRTSFPGQEHVKTVPFQLFMGKNPIDLNEYKIKNLPASVIESQKPQLIPPSPEMFREILNNLWQTYDQVICIFLSSKINPCFNNAQEAISSLSDKSRTSMFDSQTLSIGLGYIVQSAAEAIANNLPAQDVERIICSLVTRIYTIFCIPGLTYLYSQSVIDHGQAVVGEMLNLIPIFTLEEGVFVPMEKMRNLRHTLDYFLEFLYEFDTLEHISLLQSIPPKQQLSRLLRENIKHHFIGSNFSESKLSLPVSLIVGPRSTGLIAIESSDNQI